MTRYSPAFLLPAACALTLLAACDSVGDGVAPTGISLEPVFQGTGLSAREAEEAREAFQDGGPFRIMECLPANQQLILEFDNGSRENATRRSENVTYESSDPTVVEVANHSGDGDGIPFIGESADNPERFFPQGALVPRGPGTATITARFSNFESSMEVEVEPLGAIDAFVDFPAVMAPNSFAEVKANASVKGQTLSVSNAAALSITDVNSGEASEVARVQETQDGRVFALGLLPATAQQATLDFELCDRQFQTEFDIDEISELQLARTNDDGEPLVIGYSELLDATAVFSDGREQDLTSQVTFSRPDEDDNLLLLLTTATRGNSLLLPLSGAEDAGDDPGSVESGTGGTATLNASFDQDASGGNEDLDLPEEVADLPEVDATALTLDVRPGRAEELRWRVPANADDERILELPQDCSTQPGVEADITILRGEDDEVEVTRSVGRSVNYLIGDEELEGDGDGEGSGDGNGDAAADEEEAADPVIVVQDSAGLSANLQAGTISAVGEVGEEERLRAVLVQSTDIPGFDDAGNGSSDGDSEDDEIQLVDEIIVRIVERADCATVGDSGALQ